MAEQTQTQNVWERRDAAKAAAQQQAETPKKGHGCCFYGCVSAVVLTLVVVIGGIIAVRQGVKWVAKNYTSAEQGVLPAAVSMSDSRMIDLNARYEAFMAAAQKGVAGTLELGADEINELIENRAEFKDVKGKLRVAIDEDVLSGSFAVPLDALNLALLKGRYLNGSGSFKAWTRNGMMVVTMTDAEFNGKKLPAQVATELSKQNLLADLYKDVEKAKQMEKFQKIEVANGKLTIEMSGAGASGN